jgi:HlyD family secretion protein
MDVKREGVARKKRIKIALYSVLAIGLGAAGYWRLAQLKPAAPSVERATVWVDTVKRGPMVRQVRGLGTLVPEDIVWIPAAFDSQVTKVPVKSGQPVGTNTVLVTLTNPDMELAANDLEWQVKQAQANYSDLKVKLQSQRLDQEVTASNTASDLKQALLTKERDEELGKNQLKSDLEVRLSVAKWEQLRDRLVLERQRIDILKESEQAQLDAQKVQIEKLQAAWLLKKKQVDELIIRAGTDGVLQEMTLQVGQRVKPGDVLAKVAQPRKLKAELKIAETQAKDILLGQPAEIDTRNGVIPATVVRIDPNVVNGTRTVDCKLNGPLPPGAVPDLSVDGTVEIEKLVDVMFVGRPVFGQPNSQVGLFRLEGDGRGALRVPVKLGRSSVSTIEIVEGLHVGDQVILSDMSAQDQYPRIQLN